MSKEGNNEEAPQEGGGDGPKKDSGPDIYENHGNKKIVRLITVVAYVFSVSFVAIVLSAYYLFLWEPPNPRLLRRPVHLSSEPEVEFLLSDQPIVADDSKKFEDTSAQTFSGRTADTDGGNDYKRARYHREKLDESLFLLRNSLVEFLQNRTESTKSPDRDIPRKDWSISESLNYTPFDEEETRNSTGRAGEKNSKHSSKIMKRTFDSDGISLTLDSSTISGDEANKDRFTSSRNDSVPDSNFFIRADSRLIQNSTKNRVVSREKYKKIIQANMKERRLMFDKKNMETGKGTNGKMHSTKEEYLNIFKSVMNDGSDFNRTINGIDKLRFQQNNEADNVKQVFDLKKGSIVNSSRNLDLSNEIIYPQGSYESPASLENVALALKETQIEKMTTKPMAKENEQSLVPERLTTERQKDLLTILTEITDASTTVSPLTKPNDLKIDISKETAETFNRTNSKIN